MYREHNGLVTFHLWRVNMDAGRESDLSNQANAVSGYDDAVRLCQGELEMRSLHLVINLLRQLWEQLDDYVVRSETIEVVRFKKLLANDSLSIDIKESRMGHSLLKSCGLLVQDLKLANGGRIGVGEQWIVDLMPLSEFLEYGVTVVTYGRQLDPLLLKPFSCCLQLDQLRFAEGSPIR